MSVIAISSWLNRVAEVLILRSHSTILLPSGFGSLFPWIDTIVFKGTIFEPEYSVWDLLKLIIGNYYFVSHLYSDFSNRDFRQENLRFEVPVLFIIGKKDLLTNSTLAEEYFNSLICTEKTFIWFDKSAHDPQYEEVEKFSDIINTLWE